MERLWRAVGVCVMAVVAAVSVNSQEVTKSQSRQPVVVDKQAIATPDYVFPSERERLKRYVQSTVGPWRLARTAFSAGIDQWRDQPEEWGQGAKGFGRRYASSFGQNAIQQTVTYGLDEAMGLDSSFERSKREGFLPRMKDALIQNVTSRNRSGKRVISAPRFAGVYTGAIVPTETWYPERYSYKDGLRHGTRTLLTGFGINLFREFVVNW